jgi:hypothetical protein
MTSRHWEENLDSLTPKQEAKYYDAIEVLRKMRKGETLTNASKDVRVSPTTVKKYVGSALVKTKRRIVPHKEDGLLRRTKIYENGRLVSIQVRGNKKASRILAYRDSVERRIDNDKKDALVPFEGLVVTDFEGKRHRLETDVSKLKAILEKHEESNDPYGHGRG